MEEDRCIVFRKEMRQLVMYSGISQDLFTVLSSAYIYGLSVPSVTLQRPNQVPATASSP